MTSEHHSPEDTPTTQPETDEQALVSEAFEATEASSAVDSDNAVAAAREKLLLTSKDSFNNAADMLYGISEVHELGEAEVTAREGKRKRPLLGIKDSIKEILEKESMTAEERHSLRQLFEDAKDGDQEVRRSNHYLYDEATTHRKADDTLSEQKMLEAYATHYVAMEGTSHNDIPESFVRGVQCLGEARILLEELASKLASSARADRDMEDVLASLGNKLQNLPEEYDEDAVLSVLRGVNDAIAYAEDSDRARERVGISARELDEIAERLVSAASATARA